MIKTCTKCNLDKEHSPKGVMCKDCKKEYDKQYVEINKELLKSKGLEYRKKEETKNKKKSYDKSYRKENSDKILGDKLKRKASGKTFEDNKRANLKRMYNLTVEEYNLMLDLQDNKCMICGLEPDKTLVVDHNHTNGKVRELLCNHCNFLLGNARENIETLKSAIKYLEKHDNI